MKDAYYVDSSALVKRYVTEIGTDWIRSLVVPAGGNLLLTSRVTIVEIRSALARRSREGGVSSEEHVLALEALRTHSLAQYHLVEFDASVAELASELLERHPLRAYDAVQLASALAVTQVMTDAGLPAPRFLTADERLLEIASAESLPTDNPNRHP